MAGDDDLRRFDATTRTVHWATAALFAVCVLTALALYVGPIAVLVGRRTLVSAIHVYAGLALPVPMLVGLLSRAFRTDVRAMERFGPYDWRWLRSRRRRTGELPIGKFNPGQKLNAAFTAGGIVVMLGTGVMLWQPHPWPVQYRTGATFVHDWLALVFVIVVLGHLRFAFRDPESRRGMRTGRVGRGWAKLHHPGWAAEHEEPAEPTETGNAEPDDEPADDQAPPASRTPPAGS